MFEILDAANRMEETGEDVVRLEIGDTSSDVMPELLAVLQSTPFDSSNLGYSPSGGEMSLRKELARLHNVHKGSSLSERNVAVLPANAAVTHLLSLLTEPGDSVLLMDPCFPTYRLAASYLELEVVDTPLVRDRGYGLDVPAVLSHLQSNDSISVVLIDSPSNPTGVAHAPADLVELARVCSSRNIALVVDETYRNLIFEAHMDFDRVPDSVIWIYSMSKDAGAPGLRIGSVVASEELVKKIADLSSLTFSCLPKFIQIAAANYLAQEVVGLEGKKNEYRRRIEVFGRRIAKSTGFQVAPSNSSMYLWVDISSAGASADFLAHRLLSEAKVAVCPGEGFGPSGKCHVRLTVAGSYERVSEGVDRFVSFFHEQTS